MDMEDCTESDLYNAMNSNDLETLRDLLAGGGNVDEFYYNFTTNDGVSLLHLACEKGRFDCVRLIVECNVTMNVADRCGRTPLMYALAAQKTDVAEILLKKDQDLVNDEDVDGYTALDLAAIDGNTEGIRLLTQYGANVNHRTFDGVTPMMRCIKEGMMKNPSPVLWALIEGGADVNIKDKKCRRSALQMATLKKSVSAVEVLLAAGADMYSLDCGAKTPLTNMMLQHVRMRNGAMFVHEDVWMILLLMVHAGIDYNHSVCEDADPMLTAALLKAECLTRFFLSNGADPDIQTVLGVSPLLKATSKNDFPTVKTLIEWNCKLGLRGQFYWRRDDFEYTVDPYELAIMVGNLDIARFLVEAGYQNYQKPYLFDKAPLPQSLQNNPDMLEWLKNKCSYPEDLTTLAVYAVRRCMGRDIVSGVRDLPLPPKLMRMVVLKDFLELDVEY
ncbi:ankyrin repeat domain-containing protein 17-like [Haliotis rufescens]|uniref:ankyrin repeat domain-containing protein 17-like n=1 Tax=Haliotis rufescens TaxID=6454 RepID=UPI001EB030B5|nr:ankyrin repeat domain-containing protein 17-like [Haliotis rufescens]XP_048240899.1 ankyrin repeat domain-containing protein 17-like [Haliotis rufescens]